MAGTPTVTLGLLGKYYAIRHSLGHYRSACVTAIYSLTSSSQLDCNNRLQEILEISLQATIRHHPELTYGITDEKPDGLTPGYKQVEKLHRDDVMEFVDCSRLKTSRTLTVDDIADATLCTELELAHAELWPCHKPAWKMIILYHGILPGEETSDISVSSPPRLDIAFIAHHAIADGLSGIAFHNSIMENFSTASSKMDTGPIWPMPLHEARYPPVQIEDSIILNSSVVAEESGTEENVWTGGDISLSTQETFRSRVRLVMVPSSSLQRVLQLCKRHEVSLTSYLHGIICTVLYQYIERSLGLRAITPFSVRKLTGATARDIVNHISYVTTHIPSAELGTEQQNVINIARYVGAHITKEVNRFPSGSAMESLNRIKDTWSYCESQIGKKRQSTYELSNLGAVAKQANPESPLALERFIFTQCGMVTGPAMGFNCVSAQDGPLAISITWQEGIVEESLVDCVARDLERRLN